MPNHVHFSPIKLWCKFACKLGAPFGLLARCQVSPWYRKSYAPLTWDPTHSNLVRRKHGQSHLRENETGRGAVAGFEISKKHCIRTIRKCTHITQMQGKMQMTLSFWKIRRFLSSSSPHPGSLTLHPSLHSRSPNLFIGSVYRCSNNTSPYLPKKRPRKTSRLL